MRWLLRIALVAVLGLAVYRVVSIRDGAREKPRSSPTGEERIGRFPRSQFYIEHDRFLPTTDPAMAPASEARFLLPTHEVYGIVVKGEARAYSIAMISYHHVVNDVIQGIPVAITY